MAPLDIECFLILNDYEPETMDVLKSHIAPLLAEIIQNVPKLHLQVKYLSKAFEDVYPEIKGLLERVNTTTCCSTWTNMDIAKSS
jgi:hypothetical protein